MSRTVPSALRAASLASQTNEVLLEFLTISHTVAGTYYLVNNPVSIVREAHTYLPFAFRVDLPPDKEGNIGSARLTIDAVDRSIITLIRSISTRATVNIAIALASALSDELDLGTFEWCNISYNKTSISGDLTYEDRLSIMIPSMTFNPASVPGNF